MSRVIVMIAVVVAVLKGPLPAKSIGVVAEQGLWAIRNLAVVDDNKRRLGAAGACNGQ